MRTEARKLATPEEYLILERAAETKHEYVDGKIVAMAEAGLNHNRIVAELLVSIGSFLRKKEAVKFSLPTCACTFRLMVFIPMRM